MLFYYLHFFIDTFKIKSHVSFAEIHLLLLMLAWDFFTFCGFTFAPLFSWQAYS